MRTWRMIALLSLLLAGNGLWAQKSKPAYGPATGLAAGLKGEYFNGPNFERKVMTRTDAQVDFNWNWQSPGSGVQREYFSVRWTGKLYAPTSGKYRFSATVDDGVRVWVNGKKVIDEWRKQDDSHFVGEISLNGRQLYDLRIEYYNDWKGSVVSVYWESPEDRRLVNATPTTPRQTIPAKYLFSKPDRPRETVPVLVRSSGRPFVNTKREPARVPVMPVAASHSGTLLVKPTTLKLASTPTKHNVAPTTAILADSAQKPRPLQASVIPDVAAIAPAPSVDQPFENLTVGEVIVFRQVVFAQSEYTLLPESYAELDRLVKALQTRPTLQIEIAGHTDNVGDKRLNQTLSEFRAKVVATYLTRHGISDSRITSKGYGGSRPIAGNASETQRAQNRRVEFTVIK